MANVGDSLATVVKKDGSWSQMSIEHLATNQDEKERIKLADGIIMHDRVNGSLNVTRAFGDIEHKDCIIPEPDCQTMQLSDNDDLLILASDGIYRSYT